MAEGHAADEALRVGLDDRDRSVIDQAAVFAEREVRPRAAVSSRH